jgi:hypothetical protein
MKPFVNGEENDVRIADPEGRDMTITATVLVLPRK